MAISLLDRISSLDLPQIFTRPDDVLKIESLTNGGFLRSRTAQLACGTKAVIVVELTALGESAIAHLVPLHARNKSEAPGARIRRLRRNAEFMAVCVMTFTCAVLVSQCA